MQKDIFSPEQYVPGNKVELIVGGEPFFTRLQHILHEARYQIHMQMYIFDDDDTGKAVVAALKAARKRGVDVFLTVDSYGSKSLTPEFIATLKDAGVHFKLFSPLPKHYYVFRLGRRLHQKVVAVDGVRALVGGVNIADKYHGSAEVQPWLDFAIDIQGPICTDIARICERIYREKYFGKLPARKAVKIPQHVGTVRSRMVLNDWFRRKDQIRIGYRTAFQLAQQDIIVVASYFLPSRKMRTLLKAATRRGVNVRILLPGMSDVPMAKRATRYLYQWLLRNNIKIYEWESCILHGKLAVVDSKWVTIGSYNLNHLSQYSSIEMNIEVLDEAFASTVQAHLSTLLQPLTPVDPAHFRHLLSMYDRLLDWSSYTAARWIMKLLFYLVSREQRYSE